MDQDHRVRADSARRPLHLLAHLRVEVPEAGRLADGGQPARGGQRRPHSAAGGHGRGLHRHAAVPAVQRAHRVPRVPGGPGPDSGQAGHPAAGGLPDHDRAGQGTDRDGRTHPAGGQHDRLRRPARPVAAGRGRLRGGQGDVPAARGPALQPQEPRLPGVRQGHVRGQDQARQPQPLAVGVRGRVRRGDVRGHRPRAAADLRRAAAGVLPRPRGRVRGRPAVLRQPGQRDPPLGRGGSVPVPQRDPAGRERPALPDAGRHQRGHPHQRHPQGLHRLDQRGHGDQPRDPPRQEHDGAPVAVGVHPGPGGGGRGTVVVDGVLRPADAVVGRDLRRDHPAGLAGDVPAAPGRDAALLPDADLLPVSGHRVAGRHRDQRLVPRLRHQQPAHQRDLVADLLRRRGRHAVPALPVHAAAQRQPARARGVLGLLGDAGVRADRADLRPQPGQGGAPAQAEVQRDGQGVVGQRRAAVHLPLLADVGGGPGGHPGHRVHPAPALPDDDRLDRHHPHRVPGSGGHLAVRPPRREEDEERRRAFTMTSPPTLMFPFQQREKPKRRMGRRIAGGVGGLLLGCAVLAANVPTGGGPVHGWSRNYQITQRAYEAKYGLWTKLNIPAKYRVNGIHSTLLYNGDVLIMAGSGNNQSMFNAGTFKTLLLDPGTMKEKLIYTPWDVFCAGHIELPDGNILLAGGTARYENLKPVYPGGSMTVVNKDPRHAVTLAKGTIFTAPNGERFRSAFTLTVPRATSQPSEQNVWVDAVTKGKASLEPEDKRYQVGGLTGTRGAGSVYATGSAMTLQQQDFQGTKDAYIYDVKAEKYVKVNSMNYARWYPTLAEMGNGMVMTMSGLNEAGQVTMNSEMFNPATSSWYQGPARGFPTYPATFLTANGQLFFTGSNSGYGPATAAWGTPGFWNNFTQQIN